MKIQFIILWLYPLTSKFSSKVLRFIENAYFDMYHCIHGKWSSCRLFIQIYIADIGSSSLWYQESYSAREELEGLSGSAISCACQFGGIFVSEWLQCLLNIRVNVKIEVCSWDLIFFYFSVVHPCLDHLTKLGSKFSWARIWFVMALNLLGFFRNLNGINYDLLYLLNHIFMNMGAKTKNYSPICWWVGYSQIIGSLQMFPTDALELLIFLW